MLIAGCWMTMATLLVAKAAAAAATAGKAATTAVVPSVVFFLVCATNGLQNSFSSFVTANMCRTSHFTGTTTDLATIMAQCIRGNTTKQDRIPIYSGLIFLFWLGGVLGTRWTRSLQDATICLGFSSCLYLLSSIPLRIIPTQIIHWVRSLTTTTTKKQQQQQ